MCTRMCCVTLPPSLFVPQTSLVGTMVSHDLCSPEVLATLPPPPVPAAHAGTGLGHHTAGLPATTHLDGSSEEGEDQGLDQDMQQDLGGMEPEGAVQPEAHRGPSPSSQGVIDGHQEAPGVVVSDGAAPAAEPDAIVAPPASAPAPAPAVSSGAGEAEEPEEDTSALFGVGGEDDD